MSVVLIWIGLGRKVLLAVLNPFAWTSFTAHQIYGLPEHITNFTLKSTKSSSQLSFDFQFFIHKKRYAKYQKQRSTSTKRNSQNMDVPSPSKWFLRRISIKSVNFGSKQEKKRHPRFSVVFESKDQQAVKKHQRQSFSTPELSHDEDLIYPHHSPWTQVNSCQTDTSPSYTPTQTTGEGVFNHVSLTY
jgi:hypothetical protein